MGIYEAMMDKSQGLFDKRTRVTMFLPIQNEKHEKAVFDTIDYLKSKYDKPIPITGFLSSLVHPASLLGYWWSDEATDFVEEYNISFVIDFGLSFNSQNLSPTLKELKDTIASLYKHYGSEQDEIWVIAQPVERYV